jgi:hypothetical protein
LPVSEIVNPRARLSPIEDFAKRTLSAIPGLWRKLLYMAELRSAEGRYEHWGHSRVHGEVSSQQALASLHSQLYVDVLRTPVQQLMLQQDDNDEPVFDISERLKRLMVPSDLRGGSPRHLSSIVLAARFLIVAQRASTRSSA